MYGTYIHFEQKKTLKEFVMNNNTPAKLLIQSSSTAFCFIDKVFKILNRVLNQSESLEQNQKKKKEES